MPAKVIKQKSKQRSIPSRVYSVDFKQLVKLGGNESVDGQKIPLGCTPSNFAQFLKGQLEKKRTPKEFVKFEFNSSDVMFSLHLKNGLSFPKRALKHYLKRYLSSNLSKDFFNAFRVISDKRDRYKIDTVGAGLS